MNAVMNLAPLFAQAYKVLRLGDRFRSGHGGGSAFVWFVVIAAIAGLAGVIVMQYRRRNDMTVRCEDPEKLFRELSLVHRLTSGSQRTLRMIAEAAGLDSPVLVFLSPAAFDVAARRAGNVAQAEIADLRARLF